MIVVQSLSPIWLFLIPWTVTCQALLSVGFPRQEYWSRLPFPSPGDLPWPRDRTHISCISCIAGKFFTWWAIREADGNSKEGGRKERAIEPWVILWTSQARQEASPWLSHLHVSLQSLRAPYWRSLYVCFSHYRLAQESEDSSLCFTVGPCCLSTIDIVVCIC